MLEAQAELERSEMELQMDEEEREVLKRLQEMELEAIRKRRAAHEKIRAAKLKIQTITEEGESGSEVYSDQAPSEASSRSRGEHEVASQQDALSAWSHSVNQHIEDGTINSQPRQEYLESHNAAAATDGGVLAPDLMNPPSAVLDLRRHSTPAQVIDTPLNPECTTFRPVRASMLEASSLEPLVKALDTTLASQQELSRRALLPPVALEAFDGDMTKFTTFKNAFQWVVENNTEDPARRMTHLYSSLSGPPKNLIERCLHLPPMSGYEEAWRLLCLKYEDNNELNEAYMQKLFTWKEIPPSNSQALEDYASYLSKVKNALGAEYVRLELLDTMRKIVDKLPHHCKMRWIAKGDKHKFKLPALISFIEEQARIAKQLQLYDCRPAKPAFEKKAKTTPAKPLPVHSAHPPPTVKQCVYCTKTNHSIDRCFLFGRLSVDDRWSTVNEKKLCYRCLKTSAHMHQDCDQMRTCNKCGLDSHHTLLHYEPKQPGSSKEKRSPGRKVGSAKPDDKPSGATGGGAVTPDDSTEVQSAPASATSTQPAPAHHVHVTSRPDGRTMLKIVPVLVNGTYATYAFIDGGAAPTLVTKGLIQKLGLRGRKCDQTMVTEAGTFTCHEVLPLDIGPINGDPGDHVKEAFVTDRINVSTDYLMPQEWLSRWPHLKDVELHSLPGDEHQVELIVGLNTTLNRVILDQRHAGIDDPSAYLTKLGWVTFGPTGPKSGAHVPVYHVHPHQELTEVLQKNFSRDYWEKEVLSVTEDSVEDKKFRDVMSVSVSRDQGKYVASLPFKGALALPDNRDQAYKCTQSLKRRLENDEAFKASYTVQMEKYIDKNYAEKVPDEVRGRKDGRVWYMSHHAVKHPSKPKVRVVFNLKARYNGHSLNDHLLQGPDLTNNLVGVLLRFREGQFAVTADIQEMFSQVKVPEDDRD